MISPFALTTIAPAAAVITRVGTPIGILPIAATESLMSLRDEVRERKLGPHGRPFVRILKFDRLDNKVAFEAGVPTKEPRTTTEVPGTSPGEMPGGLAVTTRHTGTYESVPAAIRALGAWIGAQGLTPVDSPYQFHIDEPEVSFDRNWWETDLVWFVRQP